MRLLKTIRAEDNLGIGGEQQVILAAEPLHVAIRKSRGVALEVRTWLAEDATSLTRDAGRVSVTIAGGDIKNSEVTLVPGG